MTPSDYQKMKESFKGYLKSRAYTTKGIESRMAFIVKYWKWVEEKNMELEQVRYNDLLLYMNDLQKTGVTQETIRHRIAIIRNFYDYLIREGKVIINPAADIIVKGVKRRSLYYILEPHELHQLYNQYPEETNKDKRHKVMLGLMVYQGIRTEELNKMEVKDVKLKEGKIRIPGTYNSNSRELQLESGQIMDMYEYVLKAREELIKTKPDWITQAKVDMEKLFNGEGGRCFSISNFVTQTMIMARELNPNVVNAKQIRASVITKWLKMYNLREVQYMAGHRYVSSTEQYLQNEIEGLKEEIAQFHPLE